MIRRAPTLLALAALLAACGGSEAGPSPTPTPTPAPQDEFMSPGSDCLSCHGNAGAATAKFTAAGTVYADAAGTIPAAGMEVWIGGVKVATTNTAGNFFTTASLGTTIGSISVNNLNGTASRTMSGVATTGSCNTAGCHAAGSVSGRIHVP